MIDQSNTYILSIDGKDIINSNSTYEIKPKKKYKATLDFSSDVIQLDKVAQVVYKTKKDKNIFCLGYLGDDSKQYTNSIVNLTFKYAVKEYYRRDVDKEKIYIKYGKGIGDLKALEFENGLCRVESEIIAIKVDELFEIVKSEFMDLLIDELIELPKGFSFEANENDNTIKFTVDENEIVTVKSRAKIRQDLYKNGFTLKDVKGKEFKMVRSKRSSGSSRDGNCLFINEELYKDMMKWSMMGLEYSECDEVDLAALEAYISLTCSSIIDTIDLNPESILLIDDYKSIFKNKAMVTSIKKVDEADRLFTGVKDEFEITNSIWDGQSLLESSIFGKYPNRSMLLLRNRFFKSACFNTNIQKFFADNGITDLSQLNGKTMAKDIRDIKMITTPSSIKYLKFGSWEDFISECSSSWGIVKHEKPTKFFGGNLVQTHYQLLNSMMMNKTGVKELLQPSFDYLNALKNDIRVFRNHLGIKIKDDIEAGEINSSDDLMFTMLQLNNKFERTDLFFNFRADLIENYIDNIKKGHILVPGNYSVLFGNPLEMLKATIKDQDHPMAFKGLSVLGVDEIHCKNFKYNQKLLGCRSPHISMGNLWLANNVECKILDKYFNLSKEIVCINSIGNNCLERLSGADFDSDSLILTDSKLLIDITELNYNNFLVPTGNVKAETTKRLNNAKQKAELDEKIHESSSEIGEIVNVSQILNSKLWDMVNKGKAVDSKEVQDLYTAISQLSVMSNLSIDSAKKELTIDLKRELQLIKELNIERDSKTKKLTRPLFFGIVGKGENYCFKKHFTTMDFLQEIIEEETKDIRAKRRQGEDKDIVTIAEILCEEKTIKMADADRNQINILIKDCNQLKAAEAKIWNDEELSREEKYTKTNSLKNDYIAKVAKRRIKPATIKTVLHRIDEEQKKIRANKNSDIKQEVNTALTGIARKLISILYKSHKDSFVELFQESKEKVDTIKRVNKVKEEDEILKLYGINHVLINNN
ncbi:hypothetical protein [Desulfitobacterium sp. PCE1]|uniref:hypothetical protein n=1 Tax=Desulfitobacterium sp. PCE1 TaxID=146907 RepID=UPI00037A99D6|nr:hypothetical protein [Desulfitobacterium sp. PCE1]